MATATGISLPVAGAGEFDLRSAVEFGGTLQRDRSGCWSLTTTGGPSASLIFPVGTASGAEAGEVVSPDGAVLRSGDVVQGHGVAIEALLELPGGRRGTWARYVAFCSASKGAFAVADIALEPAPSAAEVAATVAGLSDLLVREWPCGFGFAVSTADAGALLYVGPTGASAPPGPVTLPADGWKAELRVGAHLLGCGGPPAWYAPSPAIVATYPVVAGTFEMPPTDSSTWCTRPESITIDGASVRLPEGDVALGRVELTNPLYGCAGG